MHIYIYTYIVPNPMFIKILYMIAICNTKYNGNWKNKMKFLKRDKRN